MVILVGFVALWVGLLIGSLSAARLVRNQIEFKTSLSSKPFVKENMFPYNQEDDDEFFAIINNYKQRGN